MNANVSKDTNDSSRGVGLERAKGTVLRDHRPGNSAASRVAVRRGRRGWVAGGGRMIDTSEFRRVIGHFASGVAILTSLQADGRPCGLTISSLCSVSLDPMLVLACVDHAADSHRCIQDAGLFAINVMAEHRGETLARRFATWRLDDKFQGVAYHTEVTGAPVLEDALAWLDCRIHASYPAGDHTIFVGEVIAADAREGRPLVYYRGGYGRFTP
jgi:flavin reductase (DIM6/NTAB) family NADH-FMN oxidoreductase RutF